jgi:hypothetical protein
MWEQVQAFFGAHYEVLKDFTGPIVTLVGFGITTTLALKGFNTFDRWKRERIEERRIDIAIEALSIAYEAKLVFETIRSRGRSSSEYEDGEDAQGSGGGLVSVDVYIKPRKEQIGPYLVLKRIQERAEFFERASKLEVKYMAVFGTEAAN